MSKMIRKILSKLGIFHKIQKYTGIICGSVYPSVFVLRSIIQVNVYSRAVQSVVPEPNLVLWPNLFGSFAFYFL